MLRAIVKASLSHLLLILAATTALTFLISSSYVLNKSAGETIERAVERSVGFVLIEADLNGTSLGEIKRLSGVDYILGIRWFSSEVGNETFRVVVAGDVPDLALPDIIRGKYPDAPRECALTESSYLDLGKPPLTSLLELSIGNSTLECRLVGTFAAWPISPYRNTIIANLEPNSTRKIYLLKLRLGSIDRTLEKILGLLNCGGCVRYVGGSEEFALDFLRSYRDLSYVLLISLASISVIGMSSLEFIELRRRSWIIGLIILNGRRWSRLMVMESIFVLTSSSLGIVLGLLFSWDYGVYFGEFITGRSLVNLWRYRWDYLMGSANCSLFIPATLLLVSVMTMWWYGRSDMRDLLG